MMLSRLLLVLFCLYAVGVNAEEKPNAVSISFERIDIPTLLDMVYTDILHQNYLVHSAVLEKKDLLTVRLRPNFPLSQLDGFMRTLLLSYGITTDKQKDYIYFRPFESDKPELIQLQTLYYVPRFRSADYLLNLLVPVIANYRIQVQQNQVDTLSEKAGVAVNSDAIILLLPQNKVAEIQTLLTQLDKPAKQLHVRAYVYEVTNSKTENSNALQLAFNLLSGRLQINVGALRSSGQTVILNTGEFDLLYNVFSSDTRFKTLSSPSLFVRSGESAQFVVGTETPVLSGITNTDNYQSQQVEYRTSGVVFKIKPTVLEETIDLDVTQQISSFTNTTTGVSSSPTLLKREVTTRLNIQNKQLVVMSGLKENKLQDDNTYFPFTSFSMGSEQNEQTSDIVMFLYCELLDEVNQGKYFDNSHNLDEFIISLPDK
ncbi:type II secretory pathway, component PulD [Beggiatoa alba B18LD]|uniref:Type II secretory pathway, component PulD n=1 Tax=Beggiatoa alba B18LD TaxID=395493 RepID=I3CFH1_9GAMM|nr:type II secretory pathway, component PulD [Beggiatoa alba]EIJ42364.1 type II secretory pathway, component PulD [Beggiatoa alba B18LD]